MARFNGAEITWLGHSTFLVKTPQNKVLIFDPWIEQNPSSPPEAKHLTQIDIILVSHGHYDHVSDVEPLAKKFQPQVVTIIDLGWWLEKRGVANIVNMDIGGSVTLDGITISMTPAIHSSGFDLLTQSVYGGNPVGFIVELENGFKLYHAGDTCLFGDMQLIRDLYQPDVALLPIGDRLTMGPKGAALATKLLGVKQVIPMHFATFPIFTGTPAMLREELQKLQLNDVEVIDLVPGKPSV
ncbi:metal-dependent hydrolase [Tengunoibacter tsumagoiensis]|uniref:UPF0173 metal-dependent hydrolase KTT_53960 n=1 Tax=Tengunoibacter tsumagoiensis TaxID=2014871 RepID=A0A402A8P2_9CHLR|nr:metal-dependent hydrolase [Tengunoibacter tsumagoiensis]GCE15537.1 UPF0173 metal-dependent hydrolase [Tengunoibacter tsumagoiensis]